jgi:hypothetical protein
MHRRPIRFILPAALPALLLGLVGLALASTKTINDAQGDSKKGAADIKSVTAVAGGRRVTWTITAYNNFNTKFAPCVGIGNTPSKHPAGDRYEICGDGVIQVRASLAGDDGDATRCSACIDQRSDAARDLVMLTFDIGRADEHRCHAAGLISSILGE